MHPVLFSWTKLTRWGRQRFAGVGGGPMMNANKHSISLLVEMDGFNKNEENYSDRGDKTVPDVLDPALLRPGRF